MWDGGGWRRQGPLEGGERVRWGGGGGGGSAGGKEYGRGAEEPDFGVQEGAVVDDGQ